MEQVEYLIDEVEALRTVTDTVPEPVQSGRPTDDDLSMKELYGLIAELDRHERTDWIRRARDEDTPTLSPAEATERVRRGDWNDRDLDVVLDAVQDARRDLVANLTDLDAGTWMREVEVEGESLTLFELVHRFATDDFQRLRDLGYRLHDADLSDRGEE
ncbi:hypothetical protein CRI94_16540 [Longibacter salinarum]|uniref:DinB-like domain-containing protein n=1 Tax=Longibacter salinarum TaxID=1850348 RepID=A0A2A8CTP5_9BACT|nr:hypothetical protein CRI94_16540 [Longibacter salinarum]